MPMSVRLDHVMLCDETTIFLKKHASETHGGCHSFFCDQFSSAQRQLDGLPQLLWIKS
jgi:hypothetical protein